MVVKRRGGGSPSAGGLSLITQGGKNQFLRVAEVFTKPTMGHGVAADSPLCGHLRCRGVACIYRRGRQFKAQATTSGLSTAVFSLIADMLTTRFKHQPLTADVHRLAQWTGYRHGSAERFIIKLMVKQPFSLTSHEWVGQNKLGAG